MVNKYEALCNRLWWWRLSCDQVVCMFDCGGEAVLVDGVYSVITVLLARWLHAQLCEYLLLNQMFGEYCVEN